jgi:hypothetical protein
MKGRAVIWKREKALMWNKKQVKFTVVGSAGNWKKDNSGRCRKSQDIKEGESWQM